MNRVLGTTTRGQHPEGLTPGGYHRRPWMTAAAAFELGHELSGDGCFVRQESVFRRWVTADGSSGFPAAAGRYHLYACLAARGLSAR